MKNIKKSLKKNIISDKDEEMVTEQDFNQLGLSSSIFTRRNIRCVETTGSEI